MVKGKAFKNFILPLLLLSIVFVLSACSFSDVLSVFEAKPVSNERNDVIIPTLGIIKDVFEDDNILEPVITEILLPTSTITNEGESTLNPANISTPTNTSVPTDAPAPTDTPIPTNTPTPTNTVAPTNTPTPTFTSTPRPVYTSGPRSKIGEKVLPIISIETGIDAPVLSSTEYRECTVSVFNCSEKYEIDYKKAGIRVRGNASALYNEERRQKKPNAAYPYKIKFDKKTNMLGLNEGQKFKDWVLLRLPDYLVNDYTVFKIGKLLFDGDYYSSDSCMVNLYIDDRFMGVYLLCEQSEAKPGRVEINEPASGYTGTDIGYFIEIDNYYSKEPYHFKVSYCDGVEYTDIMGNTRNFRNSGGVGYSIHSDIYSQKQVDFAKKYIDNVFKILYEATEHDKYYGFDENYDLVEMAFASAKECISAVMDINSVVCMYIVEEISCDYDRGIGSFFMAIDFSENAKYDKLTFLCPWDMEFIVGGRAEVVKSYLAGVFDYYLPEKDSKGNIVYDKETGNPVQSMGDRANPWLIIFAKQDWFREMVYDKLVELNRDERFENMLLGVDQYLEYARPDIECEEFSKVLGPNQEKPKSRNVDKSGKKLTARFKERYFWMLKEFKY
ncbi:MAG: CotH kinase family protein [Lachnospiraceae bacterium]|nr:CotH kinase family protein [Lachnospiraceae bacterium]